MEKVEVEIEFDHQLREDIVKILKEENVEFKHVERLALDIPVLIVVNIVSFSIGKLLEKIYERVVKPKRSSGEKINITVKISEIKINLSTIDKDGLEKAIKTIQKLNR